MSDMFNATATATATEQDVALRTQHLLDCPCGNHHYLLLGTYIVDCKCGRRYEFESCDLPYGATVRERPVTAETM